MIKNIFRSIIFPIIVKFRIEKLLSTFNRNKCLIIMYHGVVPQPDFNISVNQISVADFEKHLIYIKNNFEVVTLSESFKPSTGTNKRRIAITFDDGYENNYTYALPLLLKYQLPATIFVVTSALTNPDKYLWYDFIDGMKSTFDLQKLKLENFKFNQKNVFEFGTISSINELKIFMKKLNKAEKQEIISWIDKNSNTLFRNDLFKLLNSSQLRQMVESGLITIGSHTDSHPNLAEIDLESVTKELIDSKLILEKELGSSINSLAFPDGSYNEQVKEIAKQTGYSQLLAVDFKLDSDPSDNSIKPRYCISNTTTPESNFIQIHLSFSKKGV